MPLLCPAIHQLLSRIADYNVHVLHPQMLIYLSANDPIKEEVEKRTGRDDGEKRGLQMRLAKR